MHLTLLTNRWSVYKIVLMKWKNCVDLLRKKHKIWAVSQIVSQGNARFSHCTHYTVFATSFHFPAWNIDPCFTKCWSPFRLSRYCLSCNVILFHFCAVIKIGHVKLGYWCIWFLICLVFSQNCSEELKATVAFAVAMAVLEIIAQVSYFRCDPFVFKQTLKMQLQIFNRKHLFATWRGK